MLNTLQTKMTIFNLFVCEKKAYFLLFCIREIFNSVNESKYICVKKVVIVKYQYRLKHQFSIFTHAYNIYYNW